MKKLKVIWGAFSRSEQKIFVGFSAIFLVSLTISVSLIINEKTSVVPVEGGEYREGIVGQPVFINPIVLDSNDADRDIARLIFANLKKLSESIKVSEDNSVWTVRIKDDAKWHDGEPLTSDDVVFTVETIQDPDANSPLYNAWQGVVAERISAREVRFYIRTPYAFFEKNLDELLIIPQHLLGNVPPANLKLSDYRLQPIGSGPYKFVKYSTRRDGFVNSYSLTRNDQFSGDRPLIENIVLKFYPDEDRLISAFNNKEIDGFGTVDPSQLSKVRVRHDLFEARMPSYYALFFNSNANIALKDKNVRLALQTATDKNKIVGDVLMNHAIVISAPIPPGMEGYDEILSDPVPFSYEQASDILEQSDWFFTEDSAVRTQTIGGEQIRLEFSVTVPQIDFLIQTAEQLKKDWEKIGVALNINVMEPKDIAESVIKTREYEMLIFGNILNNAPDLFSFWHSSQRYYPGLNLSLYESDTADAFLESIRRNFDQQDRTEDLVALQSLIIQSTPAIFLFSPNYLYASAPRLEGFSTSFIITPSHRFDTVEKWYVKSTRVFNN